MVETKPTVDQGAISLESERELVDKSTMGRRWAHFLYKASFAILQVCRRYVFPIFTCCDILVSYSRVRISMKIEGRSY